MALDPWLRTGADIATGVRQAPCAVRRAAMTCGPKPARCRVQATVTVPCASTPASGETPCPIVRCGPHLPPAGRRVAVTVPEALHTTVVVPAASTTTSGRLTGASRASVTTGPHRSAGPVGAVAAAGAVVSSMAPAASVAAVLLLAMAPPFSPPASIGATGRWGRGERPSRRAPPGGV